jgi:hypothetical protein
MQKFKSKFIVFEASKKDKFLDLGIMKNEKYIFSKLEILSDLSFFYRPEYTKF